MAGVEGLAPLMTDRVLRKEAVVDAPLETVWKIWTTVEGLLWLSSSSRVDLRPGGDYALFLALDPDERGRRGSEGSKIVSVEAPRELVFDWTFPPDVPALRYADETTRVTLTLEPVDPGRTAISLVAVGWGQGEDWDRGFQYFEAAWGFVFDRLRQHLSGEA